MIDLTLLAQDTIDIKFDEDTIFRIPPEPSVGFTNKMMAYKMKMENAKTEEEQLEVLVEVTTTILEQDKAVSDVGSIVEQLSPSQIKAVFNIYENQATANMKNPN